MNIRVLRFVATACVALSALLCHAESAAPEAPQDPSTSRYGAVERPFLDRSAPRRFLELEAHVLGGANYITQNYQSLFSEIADLNVNIGTTYGVGVGAQFAILDFIAIGTELNLLVNNYSVDMVATGEGMSSVSSIFLNNSYTTVNIPVYSSVRFNLARGVKWNVDLGLYYTYGLGGSQKQSIYDSRVNSLGQLVMTDEQNKVDYYDDYRCFINTTCRPDLGLHLATGLTFGRHFTIELRSQIGLKNEAKTEGFRRPKVHNINLLCVAGYRF